MYKANIVFILLILTLFSGCSTFRDLRSARDRVIELERLNEEGAVRNSQLENLLKSERAGNEELERLLAEKRSKLEEYLESERIRIAAERKLADSLSGVFRESTDIIEGLIEGYRIIRTYLEDQGFLVTDIPGSGDSTDIDSDS